MSLMSKSFVKRKEKSFYTKENFKKFLKISVKERKYKTTMLVNPPPHLSHTLSSMHRECVYT